MTLMMMRMQKALLSNKRLLCIKTQFLKQELMLLHLQSRFNRPSLDLKENRLCQGKNMVFLC